MTRIPKRLTFGVNLTFFQKYDEQDISREAFHNPDRTHTKILRTTMQKTTKKLVP